MLVFRRLLIAHARAVLWGWLLVAGAAAEDRPASAELLLRDQGRLSGEWRFEEDAGHVVWQSPDFELPFQFPLQDVAGIVYSAAEPIASAEELVVELRNEDLLQGSLKELTAERVVIESARFGEVDLDRSQVRRLFRPTKRESGVQPGFIEWRPERESRWQELGGLPRSESGGASLFGDLHLPATAALDLHLTWRKRADFVLQIGIGPDTRSTDRAFSLEVWDGDIVAVVESSSEADFASVQRLNSGSGELKIRLYIDQTDGRMWAHSSRGEQLAKLAVGSLEHEPRMGIRLTNSGGDIQLNSARVVRWDGTPPEPIAAGMARVHSTDGTIYYGRLGDFRSEVNSLEMRVAGEPIEVSADRVTDIFLGAADDSSGAGRARRPRPFGQATPPTVQLTYRDGVRISGRPVRLANRRLWLQTPSSSKQMELPLDELKSLIVLGPDVKARSRRAKATSWPELTTANTQTRGRLRGVAQPEEQDRLQWQPALSSNASPFAADISGRIVFQKRSIYPQPRRRRTVRRSQRSVKGGEPSRLQMTETLVHLRTGDTIPAQVVSIDEAGVHINTPVADAKQIPHAAIKAIELGGRRRTGDLSSAERERLLTLTRLRRDSPPSHLVRSTTADFLRGTVVAMDAKMLHLDVQLDEKRIPRERVASIIWLHRDELDKESGAAMSNAPVDRLTAQAVQLDGRRLTFHPIGYEEDEILGDSRVLGRCSVRISNLEQLLLGSAVTRASDELAFTPWKLRHAVDPKFATAEDAPIVAGTESALVGQPAPDFRIALLEGGSFHLAEEVGRVVVLDFWASWCGPCLETMPIVSQVTQEFSSEQVRLISVNLEERRAQIKSLLKQHPIRMEIGLDTEGEVASSFEVRSLPQTVVIDREGRIARLFVSGGPALAGPLRKALAELVKSEP